MRLLNCSLSRVLQGVNYILIDTCGKVLIHQRDEQARYFPNKLCFPGGKMQEGKEPKAEVLRKIYDETGIRPFELQGLEQIFDFEYFYGDHANDDMANSMTKFCNRFFICTGIAPMPHIGMFARKGNLTWISEEEVKNVELALNENMILPVLSLFFSGRVTPSEVKKKLSFIEN